MDDTIHSKLTKSATSSEKLKCLKSTIIAEAAILFAQLPPSNRNLAGQSLSTKLSINLIKEKNLLLAQITSSPLSEQRIALDQLLIHVGQK